MTRQSKQLLIVGLSAFFLMAGTAALASYMTRESMEPKVVAKTPVKSQRLASVQPQPQPVQPRCDDKNIVGTVAGGAAGGLVGSQIGKGDGKTAAIIGGVVGGAVLGNQYIPTRNVTCQ